MFGMHWGFVPIAMVNLTQFGFDTMVPMLLPAVLAQGGAALAVFFITKNVKLKGLALSSTITSLFGITEPTVYGVTLPLKNRLLLHVLVVRSVVQSSVSVKLRTILLV